MKNTKITNEKTNMKRNNLKKMIKTLIFSLLLCISIIYIVVPIGFGWYASLKYPSKVDTAPEGLDDITLTTSDGVKLKAWYAPPNNNTVIILIHGGTGSRNSIRPYVNMLTKNGFGVLAFDIRGHGESTGHGNACGWEGEIDVETALNFLSKQKKVNAIGGLGISLGGEILLGSASKYPEIKAIVSDGASYRCTEDYISIPYQNTLMRSWVKRVLYYSLQFFSGDKPPTSILNSLKKAENTQVLLIAAGNNHEEIEYNKLFYKYINQKAKLWIVENIGHTLAYFKYPDEYEKRIVEFYKENLITNYKHK